MAEAENWLRLSNEKLCGEATAFQHWGFCAIAALVA
jgi:hypothetical protein